MRRNVRVSIVALSLVFGTWGAGPAFAQRIYVANSAEATVSEIDIQKDVEIARFRTWTGDAATQLFTLGSHAGPAPSRIVVDSAGNVYVLNRTWPAAPNANATLPILWKIRPTPKAGSQTSHDANGNGAIDLLNDTEVRPLTVAFLPAPPGQPRQVDPAGIKEGRIEWGMEIGSRATGSTDPGGLGRSLCMDLNGFLWVGLNVAQKYYKVNPSNGQIVPPAVNTPGHTPYGCVVDANGRLWSASSGSTSSVAEIDTTAGTSGALIAVRQHAGLSNYGISARRDCIRHTASVYLSEQVNKTHITFSTATPTAFSHSPILKRANNTIIPNFKSYAIAVDLDGNIISGKYDAAGHALVVKYDPAGNVLWDTDTAPAGPTIPGTNPTPPVNDLHGLIIDAHNNVWAVHRNSLTSTTLDGAVVKYRGTDGKHLKTIKIGREPYTYGNTLPPNCPCADVGKISIACQGQNGGVGTYTWSFTFTNQSPFPQPTTSVDLTSADPNVQFPPGGSPSTSIPLSPPVPPNGQGTASGTFTVAGGKKDDRVCIDMRLSGGTGGWCCPQQQICFTLPECRNCADARGQFQCDNSGNLYLALTVVNNGPTQAQGFQVFSTTPGVTVSPLNTQVALPPGVPVTRGINVTGASAGQTIDLTVNIHGPTNDKGVYSWCCTSTIRVTYPVKKDCGIIVDPREPIPIDH